MIDLSISIRKYLLSLPEFTNYISDYHNSYSVFTYRPVPKDAQYPMCIISSAAGGGDMDMLACHMRTIDYHVILYDQNSEPTKYINLERIANLVARSFHRVNTNLLEQDGFQVVSVTASNPFPAPTDDNETIARAITLNIEVTY